MGSSVFVWQTLRYIITLLRLLQYVDMLLDTGRVSPAILESVLLICSVICADNQGRCVLSTCQGEV